MKYYTSYAVAVFVVALILAMAGDKIKNDAVFTIGVAGLLMSVLVVFPITAAIDMYRTVFVVEEEEKKETK